MDSRRVLDGCSDCGMTSALELSEEAEGEGRVSCTFEKYWTVLKKEDPSCL